MIFFLCLSLSCFEIFAARDRLTLVGHNIEIMSHYVLQTRQAFTPELINEACYVDVNANKAVFDSLRNNPKVHYDGKRFSYKVTLNCIYLHVEID